MGERTPRIVVVGSLNMDLVIKAARRPQPGETLIGESFGMFLGGKGFNQAVAAARLGGSVQMVGRVGRDDFGRRLVPSLADEGVDLTYVVEDPEVSTGIASLVIDAQGDNSIIIVPGANLRLAPEDIDRAAEVLAAADVLMMQLEVSLQTVEHAAHLARSAGVKVLLNPAPAQPLSDDLLRLVDVLTPNETETELLTGISVADIDSAARAAQALLARGVGTVILTLGARGALLAEPRGITHVPGYRVQVVDTTAAGDAFCGALAVQLAQGAALTGAITVANAAGALATTVLGASPSMPSRQAVEQFVASQASTS